MKPTRCYTSALHEGRWRVAQVDLGEAGYLACGVPHASQDLAERAAGHLNHSTGVKHGRVVEILASVRRAELAADIREFGIVRGLVDSALTSGAKGLY